MVARLFRRIQYGAWRARHGSNPFARYSPFFFRRPIWSARSFACANFLFRLSAARGPWGGAQTSFLRLSEARTRSLAPPNWFLRLSAARNPPRALISFSHCKKCDTLCALTSFSGYQKRLLFSRALPSSSGCQKRAPSRARHHLSHFIFVQSLARAALLAGLATSRYAHTPAVAAHGRHGGESLERELFSGVAFCRRISRRLRPLLVFPSLKEVGGYKNRASQNYFFWQILLKTLLASAWLRFYGFSNQSQSPQPRRHACTTAPALGQPGTRHCVGGVEEVFKRGARLQWRNSRRFAPVVFTFFKKVVPRKIEP